MNELDEPLVNVENLTEYLRRFALDRKWDQFHSPKNLAMALVGEVGELAAELQWLTPEETLPENLTDMQLEAIAEEVADVAIYLTRLVDKLEIDLNAALVNKLQSNEDRYSIDDYKGTASKAPKSKSNPR